MGKPRDAEAIVGRCVLIGWLFQGPLDYGTGLWLKSQIDLGKKLSRELIPSQEKYFHQVAADLFFRQIAGFPLCYG